MRAKALAGGRYRLERPLGVGGMASVYAALDAELDRPVAVKVLAEQLARDAGLRERFVREARLAGRLSHPNVVSVYDAGEQDGLPYIVMEYVDGETLADVLRRRGRVPPDEATALARQSCRGLEHAHAAGLVHRDIKPQNLLLGRDGTLKIADFGIARTAEATRLTQTGTVLGSAAYLSPEQAVGEEVTPAADLYALGVVLYELLSGRPPYEFTSLADLAAKQDAGAITPLGELVPDVPSALEDVVMRCLARNPAYRPASAGALARELQSAVAEPLTILLPAPRKPAIRKRPVLLALAGALVVGAVLLAVALATGGPGTGGAGTNAPVPAVRGIPRGASPQEEAHNLRAWIELYSR
jgi:eukaryotic-like serine/threonine-protein kinase